MSVVNLPLEYNRKPKVVSFFNKKKEKFYRALFRNVPENIFSKYKDRIINGELSTVELKIIFDVATRGSSPFEEEIRTRQVNEAKRYLNYQIEYNYLSEGFKCNYNIIKQGLNENFYSRKQVEQIVRNLNQNNIHPLKFVNGKQNLESKL